MKSLAETEGLSKFQHCHHLCLATSKTISGAHIVGRPVIMVIFLFNCFSEHILRRERTVEPHSEDKKESISTFEQQFINTQYHMHYNVLC